MRLGSPVALDHTSLNTCPAVDAACTTMGILAGETAKNGGGTGIWRGEVSRKECSYSRMKTLGKEKEVTMDEQTVLI